VTSVDPYGGNPFRVLGVGPNCSGKESARAADRLLKWIELGETPEVEDLLPYLGLLPRDREQIKNASKEVEDPRSRIRSELYWPSPAFSVFDNCKRFLKTGQYGEFVSHCEKAIADAIAGRNNDKKHDSRLDACLGRHCLAVFYHSSAIAASRRLGEAISGEKPTASWDHAFRYWTLIINDEFFWTYLANRARLLNDPRVNASYVQELRRELPLALLRVNVSRAVAGVEREQPDELVQNCRIIRKAKFGSNEELALTEVALALQAQFEKTLQGIQSSMSESAIRMHVPRAMQSTDAVDTALDPPELTSYLATIEDSIAKTLVPIGKTIIEAGLDHIDPALEILDGLAYAYRSISLAFNNYGRMPRASLRLTATAKEFARGAQCQERLDEDCKALQFLSLQKDALELAAESRYRDSLAKLEEAKQFAASDEDRRTIDEWVEVAKERTAYEGLKKLDCAPTMYTFNGIGTMLYGRRDYDPHSQSYIATLYLTFIFLPLFPLASYRVKSVNGNRYQFLGRASMKKTAFIGPAIVAAVAAIFMILSTLGTTTSPQTQNDPSSSAERITESKRASTDKDNLGQWIDQERSKLDSDKINLQSEESQIDIERQSLDQRDAALKVGSPSQEEIDSYNADVQRFNLRVQAYKARFENREADIRSLNAYVNQYNSMP
jgi:hypothetical protein